MNLHSDTLPRTILPEGWPRPPGFAHAMLAEGRMLFIAGQIGATPEGVIESDDFVEQFAQTLRITKALLEDAGLRPEHLVRMTWYITDKQEYLANLSRIGKAYREVIGPYFPAMAVVEVAALIEDRAKVEIESTAVMPL